MKTISFFNSSRSVFVATTLMVLLLTACVPIRPPNNAYQDATTLLTEMNKKRDEIKSFRMAGSIDHIQEQRVRGKAYIFARLPDNLRIDILSPFGNTLSVLTANPNKFGLSDYKESRFFSGIPAPCNVAKFVGIALPPADIITILIGKVPLIEGDAVISWDPNEGQYIVTITHKDTVQILHIGADKKTLPLLRAEMHEKNELVFDVQFDMWRNINDMFVPNEIRIRMPKDNSELFVQYEDGGVELNVTLPDDAWDQTIPSGAEVEQLSCD